MSTLFDQVPEGVGRSEVKLRPYQEEAKAAVLAAFEREQHRPLVQLPTGMGKTVLFGDLAKTVGYPVLILAHRDELLDQAADKMRGIDPGVTIGKVKAGVNQAWLEVTVASVQTLARQNRLDAMPTHYKLIVVDEAHHAAADSYQRIMQHFKGVPILGVTATPERGGGHGLEGVWHELVYQYPMLRGIREGYLADIRGLRVELKEANFDALRVNRGDWQDGQMASMLHDVGAPRYALKAYLEHAPERKGLIFTPTVDLAHEMADTFREAGVPAEALDGTTPRDVRAGILRRLRSGETRIVANCAVLTEGFDEPSIDLIVIARPTLSRVLYVQMVGRGTRTHPGKRDVLVMDLVGASERNRLQSVPNLFGVRPDAMDRGLTVGQAISAAEQAAAEQAESQARLAEIEAKVVDLFSQRELNWLRTNGGDHVLTVGDGLVRLRPLGEGDLWTVVLEPRAGERKVLGEALDLGYAQGVAEDFVREEGATFLNNPQASWRRKPASPKQLGALAKWGIRPPEQITAGEASDLLTARIAEVKGKAA